jgi:hypothetical protein
VDLRAAVLPENLKLGEGGEEGRDNVRETFERTGAHRISTDPVAGRTHPAASRWSVPARYSTTASSSNDPTNQRVVISKSRDTPIHRS